MSKVATNHVDFHHDKYIAGVAGLLTAEEQGVYWMICTLIYSHGGPIDEDLKWLARMFADMSTRRLSGILDSLVAKGKIERVSGAQLTANGTKSELIRTQRRIESSRNNGAGGGRPPKKNKHLAEPDGSFSENPSFISTSTSTSTSEEKEGTRPSGRAATAAANGHSAKASEPTAEADLFRRGKEVLGQGAGGMIKLLLKANNGDADAALTAIEVAATKQSPIEWIGGWLRKRQQQAKEETTPNPRPWLI